ncbi:hypothetical protein PM082_001818 [Marasmius tenuissimus]|nr:hypothetical protein PM082_001818 [Marasmius tenuissimus]
MLDKSVRVGSIKHPDHVIILEHVHSFSQSTGSAHSGISYGTRSTTTIFIECEVNCSEPRFDIGGTVKGLADRGLNHRSCRFVLLFLLELDVPLLYWLRARISPPLISPSYHGYLFLPLRLCSLSLTFAVVLTSVNTHSARSYTLRFCCYL